LFLYFRKKTHTLFIDPVKIISSEETKRSGGLKDWGLRGEKRRENDNHLPRRFLTMFSFA
jgi:hypothetical protein